MSGLCFNKCVTKMHGESDLNVGEMSCVDRCVNKYMEAQEKVHNITQLVLLTEFAGVDFVPVVWVQ